MKRIPIFYAILAAVCYGISSPAAKIILEDVPPVLMAALLYLGALRSAVKARKNVEG
jgi:drug/metabolite transporter (DMT)-like permease